MESFDLLALRTASVKRLPVLALVALGGVACGPKRTEMFVAVNNFNVAVPADIDSIHIKVGGSGTAYVDTPNLPLCEGGASAAGCYQFPVTLTLFPGTQQPDATVRVEVDALIGDSVVIADAAVFTFTRGVSQRLDFDLFASCLHVDCAQLDQVCVEDGQCRPLVPMPLDSAHDLAPSGVDAADDAAVVDAAQDLSPPGLMLSLLVGAPGGTGTADGIGSAARFLDPAQAAYDGAGHLFLADTSNQTIRQIDLASGAVTTVAGLPNVSGSVDAAGSAARFSSPSGVVADRAGNLYVADTLNQTIRKIVLVSGAVSTFAGLSGVLGGTDGVGSAARFSFPSGLAFDGADTLFVADASNHTIRQVALSTATVSTLAGQAGMSGSADGTGGVARFNGPFSVTYALGQVYVADTSNSTLRQVMVPGGVVTTLVGAVGACAGVDGIPPAVRLCLPEGVVHDGVSTLYVGDFGNHSIRQVSMQGAGATTTVAGQNGVPGTTDGIGGAARFNHPLGVELDGAGNLYVSDSANSTIRRVALASGTVTTLAGQVVASGSTDGIGEAARFSGPLGVASDGAGNLYLADNNNAIIRRVVLATGAVSTVAGVAGAMGSADGSGAVARFSAPHDVAADGAGMLYVVDAGNDNIRRVALASGMVSTIAGLAGSPGSADGVAGAARFLAPQGIACDGTTALYVADTLNDTIRRIDLTSGAVTTVAGAVTTPGSADGVGGAARFSLPSGMVADGAGALLIADSGNHTIRRLEIASGMVTTVAGLAGASGSSDGSGAAARLNNPFGLASDGAGTLYIADTGNHTIRRLLLATGEVSTFAGVAGQGGVLLGPVPGRLNRPHGVALLPGGGLAVSVEVENAVLIIR